MSDDPDANQNFAAFPHATSLAKLLDSFSENNTSPPKHFNLKKQLKILTAAQLKQNSKHSPPKSLWTPLNHCTSSAGITSILKNINSHVKITELENTDDPIKESDSPSPQALPRPITTPFSLSEDNNKDDDPEDDNNNDDNIGNGDEFSTPHPTLKPRPVTIDSLATQNPPPSPTEKEPSDHPSNNPPIQLDTTTPVAGSSILIKTSLESSSSCTSTQHVNAQSCPPNPSNNSTELPFSSFKSKLEFALSELGKELKSLSIDESRPFGKQNQFSPRNQ